MDGASFDELAKAVRAGRTRRQAAGGLLGLGLAVLSSRPLTEAKGKRHAKHKGKGQRGASGPSGKGGNSACAHFCAQVFGADTPAAGQCTSDAAHGNGLCRQCGADVGKACCAPQNGVCPDYTTATCCAGKDTCGGGGAPGVCGCTPNCTNKCGGADDGCGGTCTADCPAGRFCLSQACLVGQGSCHAGDNYCSAGGGHVLCDGTSPGTFGCDCYQSIEGATRCGATGFLFGTGCTSSAECAAAHPAVPGIFCAQKGIDCGVTTCYKPCPQ